MNHLLREPWWQEVNPLPSNVESACRNALTLSEESSAHIASASAVLSNGHRQKTIVQCAARQSPPSSSKVWRGWGQKVGAARSWSQKLRKLRKSMKFSLWMKAKARMDKKRTAVNGMKVTFGWTEFRYRRWKQSTHGLWGTQEGSNLQNWVKLLTI